MRIENKPYKKEINERGYNLAVRNKAGSLFVGFLMEYKGKIRQHYQYYCKGASPAFLDKYFKETV